MRIGSHAQRGPDIQIEAFFLAETAGAQAVAHPARHGEERGLLSGDVPSPANPPSACRFHTRCPKAQELCSTEEPLLEDKGSGTRVACHYPLTREETPAIGVRSDA